MVNEGLIDFYENLYRIRRKSKYQRKYHMNNVLQDKLLQNPIDLTTEEMNEFISNRYCLSYIHQEKN